ncbi:hypothetical protein [Peterkaempfera bronchialis]|uniref:hypothetical protein n=1 Tax=Peterkaempfera bronchialis TaxID=2126346 RepID=UPI003C2BA47E
MILSVSAVVGLGVVVVLLVRSGGPRVWHAAVFTLLGFYLASSSLAPSIRRLVGDIAGAVAGLRL